MVLVKLAAEGKIRLAFGNVAYGLAFRGVTAKRLFVIFLNWMGRALSPRSRLTKYSTASRFDPAYFGWRISTKLF